MQVLPSLHVVPFAAFGFEHTPVAGLHVPATWHWSSAVQVTAVPVQTPVWQLSAVVQALASLHVVPFGFAGFVQSPLVGSQVPALWHWSDAVHTIGVPPHVPFVHASPVVHVLPSLHVVPFAAFGFEQVPVDGLHVPATWHWSSGVHTTGFVPAHVPFWHVSVRVQAFPSLHVVPFAAFGFEHTPVAGLHVPATWHWSSAVHTTGVPAAQVPFWHVSAPLHRLLSAQLVPFATGV